MLCEGYLGVLPYLNVFRYFIVQWETRDGPPTDIDRAGFRLRKKAGEYISSWMPMTNQGWH